MTTERQLRLDMVAVGRLLYEKNLIVATDGNVSIRLPRGRLLSTPSGANKGLMKPADLIITDMKGKKISGPGKPTSELRLHLAIYEARPDVAAVVHAHPPVATAFTVAGVSLADFVIPEAVFTLGSIPTSEYATPASEQGPLVIKKLIHSCDAVILDRHGAVTCGPDVWDAFKKMEKVEHAALVNWYARQLGKVKVLPPDEVEKLMAIHDEMGLPGRMTVLVTRPAKSRRAKPRKK
jgi:L-fuculose-phosphate aldolase